MLAPFSLYVSYRQIERMAIGHPGLAAALRDISSRIKAHLIAAAAIFGYVAALHRWYAVATFTDAATISVVVNPASVANRCWTSGGRSPMGQLRAARAH
jgi:hypothetical protein